MFNTKYLILFFMLISNLADAEQCVPAYEYIPYASMTKSGSENDERTGQYQRVSPDGRYVLRSDSGAHLGSVTLLEIKKSASKNQLEAYAYKTPLANEAYALLSTFRFVVDVSGQHHKISDIKSNGKNSKSYFKAGESGWYAASTELPSGTDNAFKIRSIAWPNNNASTGFNRGSDMGKGILYMSETDIIKEGGSYKIKNEVRYKLCENLENSEGAIFFQPMISPSGQFLSAMPTNPKGGEPTMRIYKILDSGRCEKIDDLGKVSQKAALGLESNGKAPPVMWSGPILVGDRKANSPANGLYVRDPELGLNFYLGDDKKSFQPVGFPNMTKDGRIVVSATWKNCSLNAAGKEVCSDSRGIVRLDPNQSADVLKYKSKGNKSASWFKKCVSTVDVLNIEKEQNQIYGFDLPSTVINEGEKAAQ